MSFSGATTTNIKLIQAVAGDTGYTEDFNTNLQLIDTCFNGPGLTVAAIGATYYCKPHVDDVTLSLTSSSATATLKIKPYGSAITASLATISFVEPVSPDYAIQSMATGINKYGFVTLDEAHSTLKTIANIQKRVNQLELILKTYLGIT